MSLGVVRVGSREYVVDVERLIEGLRLLRDEGFPKDAFPGAGEAERLLEFLERIAPAG